MAGSFRQSYSSVITLKRKSGREVQIGPYQLIAQHGVQKRTKTWSCTIGSQHRCKRRSPARFSVANRQD
jgi:hypothetical protein